MSLVDGDAETRERIAIDLHAIVRAVLLSDPPAKLAKKHHGNWRWNWLMACLWGYLQTDLDAPHESGEDASGWREDAARMGIDLSGVRGMTWAELRRDKQQAALFAAHQSRKILEAASRLLEGE